MDTRDDTGKATLIHGLLALLLTTAILAWGIIWSPPMKGLREAIGLHDLPGSRFNGEAAEIIDPSQGTLFLARITHYYHSLFAALLYGTLVALTIAFKPRNSLSILNLALAGSLMTSIGGLGYAYVAREFYLHGLFIAGLATLFATGLLAAAHKPRDILEATAYTAGILLLGGGIIGGYIGSSYMNPEISNGFPQALDESRYNPGLAEHNTLWRAWTGHQHAMIALVMVLAFTAAARLLETPRDKLTKTLLYTMPPATLVMALASYLVWPIGGKAHLAITPAALTLSTTTTLLSWRLKAPGEHGRPLLWTLRLGNILLWLYVIIPGALIAASLHKPAFYNPPIRDPSRDWMELAYNIGHWHLLLTGWGVTLLATANTLTATKASAWSTRLALAGYAIAGLGATLYYTTPPPQPYQPNPYNNMWVTIFIEPGLAMLALGVGLSILFYLWRIYLMAKNPVNAG